jgi:hypothetical protein
MGMLRIRLLRRAGIRGASILFSAILGVVVGLAACQTPLPDWDPHGAGVDGGPEVDAGDVLRLTFDPPAAPDAVTRVTRVHVELAQRVASPRVVLVEGAVSAAQLRELARSTISQALSARVAPSLVWTSSESALVVAPLAPLARGTLYTVGIGEPAVALSFTTAADDGPPLLARVWPDSAGTTVSGRAAVWCGRDALEFADTTMTLAPAPIAGRLTRGTGASLATAGCVSWLSTADAADASPTGAPSSMLPAGPAITPASAPLVGGALALLEPVVLWSGPRAPPPDNAVCTSAEVGFGSACATVLDDRIVVRPPVAPVLWTIATGAETIVRPSRAERPFVVRPLPLDARFRFAVLDEGGRLLEAEVPIEPAPPRSHVIINEVMANPAGVERAQEWVELFNDGRFPVSVQGYALETGGGTVLLPAGVIEPGAFALVVTDAYEIDDGVDPVAAPGTLLLRVAALGRDGLSNDGERLSLRDAAGSELSTFPAMKAKNGVSNARLAPDALDGDADAFAPSPGGGATPGAPNARP